MKKNVASQSIGAQVITASDGSEFTGVVSVSVTVDSGTQTVGAGTVTHKGKGYHSYSITQSETNGDHIGITFSATGAITTTVQTYTQYPQSVDNATNIATILSDTNELQVNQGGWLTATGFATTAEIADVPTVAEFNARTLPSASYFDFTTDSVIVVTNNDKSGYSITGTLNTLDSLNNFNPATDAVSNVTLVATTTTNTDMRGTDGANTTVPDNTSITNILADTNELQLNQSNWLTATGFSTSADISALNDISVNEILTTQMTESYSADGVAPTIAQAMFNIQQNLGDFSYNGTVKTTRKLNGTTTAMTYTLDDATNPTSSTRAT